MKYQLTLWIGLLPACATFKGPESEYVEAYSSSLANLNLPTLEASQEKGIHVELDVPFERARRAVLEVARKSHGILSLENPEGGPTRVVFVSGKVRQFKVPFGYVNPERFVTKFVDRWLDLSVHPRDAKSLLSVSWIAPGEGSEATPGLPEQAKLLEASSPLASPYLGIMSAYREHRIEIQHKYEELEDSSGTEKEARMLDLTALDAASSAVHDVIVLCMSTEEWVRKYSDPPPQTTRSGGEVTSLGKDWPDREKELKIANWQSSAFLKGNVIVSVPAIEEVIADMTRRLRAAADLEDKNVRVFVNASHEVNAYAVANGDVFICSGLLDALEDRDQLAAVIAHELDHFAQHDFIRLQKKKAIARDTAELIGALASVAGSAVGAINGLDPTTLTMSTSATVTQSALQQAAGMFGSGVSSGIGGAIVGGYSEEQELRADSNGIVYMWRAGYDPKAAIRLFEMLETRRDEAELKKELLLSKLVNSKPGLQARKEGVVAKIESLGAE